MEEKLEELLRRIGILKNELMATSVIEGEPKPDSKRRQVAMNELRSISASDNELPVARYAAARAAGINIKRNLSHGLKLWLHEDAAEDIAALGIVTMFAGITALFCYGSYKLLY